MAGVALSPIPIKKPAGLQGGTKEERAHQANLIRDIFGNPFRPVAFSPSWRTSTAVALAHAMYESRDFAAMPILADALQDAGCDNADILDPLPRARPARPRVLGGRSGVGQGVTVGCR